MRGAETLPLREPTPGVMPPCEFCGHEWHGLECRESYKRSVLEHPIWPSQRGRPCGCPCSFVEPPC